jgi:hypothetical protein
MFVYGADVCFSVMSMIMVMISVTADIWCGDNGGGESMIMVMIDTLYCSCHYIGVGDYW